MGPVEVRINGLIVIFLELSFTGAGCLIYILFPIPAIRFSHRDTRHWAWAHGGCSGFYLA
jgi:hypothetical protein